LASIGERLEAETRGVSTTPKKTYSYVMSRNREEWEEYINTPMKARHKLPWWIFLGLIALGIGKLIGVL